MTKRKKVVIVLDSDSSDEEMKSSGKKLSPSSSSEVEIIEEFTPKRNRSSKKRSRLVLNSDDEDFYPKRKRRKVVESTPPSANKFHIPAIPTPSQSNKSTSSSFVEEKDLWVDFYAPQKEIDLPVRKQKVNEVKEWMNVSLKQLPLGIPNTPRILVLTGPTGGCKTSMIQVLSKQLHVQICEWIDPSLCLWKDADDNLITPYISRLDNFRAYLLRSDRYESILANNDEQSSFDSEYLKDTSAVKSEYLYHKKIILLEQIPYLHDFEQHKEFNNIISDFLLSSRFPMIIILSDDQYGSSSLSKLLDTNIISSPLVNIININPVSPTAVYRVLKNICQKEQYAVPIEILERLTIVSNGDLRNAVTSLQFYCKTLTKSRSRVSYPTKTPSFSQQSQLSQSSKDSNIDLLLGARDTTFSLYHTIGKMCHHKREEGETIPHPLIDLQYHREPLTFVPEEVFKSVHIPPWTYNLFVHENYLTVYNDINEVADAASYFSDADIIDSQLDFPYRNERKITSYIDSIACRGVLYCNTSERPKKFLSMYSPLFFQYNLKKKELSNMINSLFIRGATSANNLRSQGSLLSTSNVLYVDVLPMVKQILKPQNISNNSTFANVSLTSGQQKALDILNTFSSSQRRSKMDQNSYDDGHFSEATLIKNLTKQCYDLKISDNNEQDDSLLLKIGGTFNEVLKDDDIEDFED